MRWLFILAIALAGCSSPKSPHKVYYPNGQIRVEQQTDQQLPHGPTKTYYRNGFVKTSGTYNHGTRQGEFRSYSEDGALVETTLYLRGAAIWISSFPDELPPDDLLAIIEGVNESPEGNKPGAHQSSRSDTTLVTAARRASEYFFEGSPSAQFSSLERSADRSRIGIQFGGAGAADEQSVSRMGIFGNYSHSNTGFGVYADVTSYRLRKMSTSDEGRRTIELAGTYVRDIRGFKLSSRLGVMAPIGNDTQYGASIASAASVIRPTDSVASLPSTVSLRGGSSWSRSGENWVLQGDTYLDLAMGGAGDTTHPFGRVNGALGFGGENMLASFESVNTLRLDDTSRSVHALGVSLLLVIEKFSLSLLLSRTKRGSDSITGGLGREF